jgi:Raf kinase inhibitor-like YbhB/YbcL family protein
VKLGLGRRAARRLGLGAVAVCCALPASGCGLLGSGAAIAPPAAMTISSPEFLGNVMPVNFTCGVTNPTSPPLSWGGAPPGTKSLALVVDDSSAPITPFVYWVVFNISPQTLDILEGQLPPGAEQARNSSGSIGYLPPCPGSTGHTYRFTVYALSTRLSLADGASLASAWQAIAAKAIPGGRGRTTASATS